MLVVDTAADLGHDEISAVAHGSPLELSPALLDRLTTRRDAVLDALRTGQPVYGVNTGMGALSGTRLDEAEQRAHQRNLLLGRAVGGAPWLPAIEARAVVVTRLRTFLSGDSGVSSDLCQQLVFLLNAGVAPPIPAGGAGSAGEIIPLAHAFGPLVGIGSVLGSGGDPRPAGGIGLPAFELGPKEGIALLAGIPGTTGRALLHAQATRELVARMGAVAAGAIAVVGASRDPYSDACGRGDDVLGAELARLRDLAGPEPAPRSLQAPVSFRVAGHVLAHLVRSVSTLEGAVERALTGVTDSPAYDEASGQFLGTAGFHGIDLAAHCDQLAAALAHTADVSCARLHRLLDESVTGLPRQLAREPGPQAGLVAVHKRAVAATHLLRRAASPSAIGAMETSNGQEDVQSFSWEAAGQLGEAIRLSREVTACELLGVFQAFALSPRAVPPGLRDLVDSVAAVVPPIDADRPFGEDLERLIELLSAA